MEEGRIWTFATGSCICYNEQVGEAFEIHGAIYGKWNALGGLNWAVPSTDELPTPDGVGRFNHFSNAGSIYWTPETGANVIYGFKAESPLISGSGASYKAYYGLVPA
jgi:uncharacterized protein with LGFP repeats